MLYTCVNTSASTWVPEVEACLQQAVGSKSLEEPGVAATHTRSSAPDSFIQVFATLTSLLFEYVELLHRAARAS